MATSSRVTSGQAAAPSVVEDEALQKTGVTQIFSLRRIVQILGSLIVAFSIISFIGQVIVQFVVPNNEVISRVTHWLDVNAESSIPTWYASLTLMLCSILLAFIAYAAKVQNRPYPLHWASLSVGFALLSLEEVIGIHSQVFKVLRSGVSITKGSGYILVLGALALAGLAVLVLLYGRFFLHLPKRWRYLFVTGLIIYLTGVLATDTVGDYLRTAFGESSILYTVVLTVEEALEMTGVLIFIYALVDYIRQYIGSIHFQVRDPQRPVASE
jgi:hypothetical protein